MCPVPAVAAEAAMMARLTTTWTKPDEPELGFFLLMVSLLGMCPGAVSPVDGTRPLCLGATCAHQGEGRR